MAKDVAWPPHGGAGSAAGGRCLPGSRNAESPHASPCASSGIDTPEVVDPRAPVQCFAREASAYAHALLDGQLVSIGLDPSPDERDRYGRSLAYLWLPDGRSFGEVMIADGFAREYTYDLPYASQGAFKAAQEQAMANQ